MTDVKILIPGVTSESQVSVFARGTRIFVNVQLTGDAKSCGEYYRDSEQKWNEVKREDDTLEFFSAIDPSPEFDVDQATVAYEEGKLLFNVPMKQPRLFKFNTVSK